jgi:sulfite exporter TauE/SafE
VLTYTWLGLVLGLAGGFLITPKVQSSLSFLFGAAILLSLVLPKHLTKSISQISPTQNLFLRLRMPLGKLLSLQTHSSYLGIGMLNGLLPCGMIYLALASPFCRGVF